MMKKEKFKCKKKKRNKGKKEKETRRKKEKRPETIFNIQTSPLG